MNGLDDEPYPWLEHRDPDDLTELPEDEECQRCGRLISPYETCVACGDER